MSENELDELARFRERRKAWGLEAVPVNVAGTPAELTPPTAENDDDNPLSVLSLFLRTYNDGRRHGFRETWAENMDAVAEQARAILTGAESLDEVLEQQMREDLAAPMLVAPWELKNAEEWAATLGSLSGFTLAALIRSLYFDIYHDVLRSVPEYVGYIAASRLAAVEYFRRRGEETPAELWHVVDSPGPNRPPHLYEVRF